MYELILYRQKHEAERINPFKWLIVQQGSETLGSWNITFNLCACIIYDFVFYHTNLTLHTYKYSNSFLFKFELHQYSSVVGLEDNVLYIKKLKQEFPAEMNQTRNHEVAGSIPGLAQWVKYLALPQSVVQVTDVVWICHCCVSGIGWQLQL